MDSTNLNEINELPAVKFRQKPDNKTESLVSNQEVKISELKELKIGDHAILSLRDKPEQFCHVLVKGIQCDPNIVFIIYFGDGKEFLIDLVKKNGTNQVDVGVKQNLIMIDMLEIEIHRYNYEINDQKCLSTEETIAKAEKFVGESKYNLFANNDEHFCIFCKTGKAAKLFITNPKITSKKIAQNLKDNCVRDLATQGGQIVLVNTAKHVATKFPRSAVSNALPAVADACCAVLGAGIEGVAVGYDIYQKNKDLKQGKINSIKFKKYVATRVTRGTMSAAGGVAGAIVGQMVIPVPVVGAVVGSLVGGLCGAATGQLQGILLGELVEVIDNKLENGQQFKKLKMSESVYEDLSNNAPVQQYNVLQHLVIKYKKDILREENYEHLCGYSTFYTHTIREDNNENATANDLIESDDYEVFIINEDTEEIIDEKIIRQSINRQSSIDEINTDELSFKMNIFMSINE